MINHKSYLLIVGLLILSGMLYSCQSQKQANVKAGNDIYASQYSQKWDQVYNYILRNWGKTAVQSKKLPKPFLPAMGTKPIFFYWDNYFIDAGVLETDSLAHYAKMQSMMLFFWLINLALFQMQIGHGGKIELRLLTSL